MSCERVQERCGLESLGRGEWTREVKVRGDYAPRRFADGGRGEPIGAACGQAKPASAIAVARLALDRDMGNVVRWVGNRCVRLRTSGYSGVRATHSMVAIAGIPRSPERAAEASATRERNVDAADVEVTWQEHDFGAGESHHPGAMPVGERPPAGANAAAGGLELTVGVPQGVAVVGYVEQRDERSPVVTPAVDVDCDRDALERLQPGGGQGGEHVAWDAVDTERWNQRDAGSSGRRAERVEQAQDVRLLTRDVEVVRPAAIAARATGSPYRRNGPAQPMTARQPSTARRRLEGSSSVATATRAPSHSWTMFVSAVRSRPTSTSSQSLSIASWPATWRPVNPVAPYTAMRGRTVLSPGEAGGAAV